jgi:MFS family permease
MTVRNQYYLVMAISAIGIASFGPTYMRFLLAAGLSPVAANSINTIYMFSIFLLQIPTGVLSDIFGYEKAVFVGLLSHGLAGIIYYIGGLSTHPYPLFCLAEICAAISFSLLSGAVQGWIAAYFGKDQIKNVGIQARINSKLIAIIVVGISAYLATIFGLGFPWLMDAVFNTSAALLWYYWFMRGKEKSKGKITAKITERHNWWTEAKVHIASSIKVCWGISSIRWIIIGSGIATFAYQSLNMFWSPITEVELGSAEVGIGSMLINACLLLSAILVKRIRYTNSHRILASAAIYVGFCVLLSTISHGWWWLIWFALHELGRELRPLIEQAVIDSTRDKSIRATVLSTAETLVSFNAAAGLIVGGLIAETPGGFRLAIAISGLLMFLAASAFWNAGRFKAVRSETKEI